jgi:uncharacterized protein YggE
MTQLIRNVCIASVLVAQPPRALAQQSVPTEQRPTVSATGEGVVEAIPDRAWITITAESRAGNPRAAQQRNTEAMAPVVSALKAAGVPAEAIRTLGYDLQQEWDYTGNRRISRGYVARNTIDVRVDRVDRVGELLEVVIGSGAISVGGVRFDLKDRATLERQALQAAVSDARARADAAAAGAGLTIDRILRIESQSFGGAIPVPHVAMMRAQTAQGADAAPPITAGPVEIRAQVALIAVLK